jgi:Domain of unknown function (DUF4386)
MSTTLTLQPSPTADPARRSWPLGLFLIAEGALALAPLAILGPAIGWPASLDAPAAQQLAAIHAAPGALQAGYGLYLLYSLLIAPLMVVLAARQFGGLQRPLAATVAAFGVLSALARAIGILRWLTAMPELATAHAAAEPAQRAVIEQVFAATTAYGGGIGELLGVSLLMALSLGLYAGASLVLRLGAAWLNVLGLVAALLLAGLALPAFGGPDLVPVAAAVSLLSVWMWAAGVRAFWRG